MSCNNCNSCSPINEPIDVDFTQTGERGPIGPQGIQGEQGPQGIQGIPGVNAGLKWKTVLSADNWDTIPWTIAFYSNSDLAGTYAVYIDSTTNDGADVSALLDSIIANESAHPATFIFRTGGNTWGLRLNELHKLYDIYYVSESFEFLGSPDFDSGAVADVDVILKGEKGTQGSKGADAGWNYDMMLSEWGTGAPGYFQFWGYDIYGIDEAAGVTVSATDKDGKDMSGMLELMLSSNAPIKGVFILSNEVGPGYDPYTVIHITNVEKGGFYPEGYYNLGFTFPDPQNFHYPSNSFRVEVVIPGRTGAQGVLQPADLAKVEQAIADAIQVESAKNEINSIKDTFIRNSTDVFGDKVTEVVSLTQGQYDALALKISTTMYIITAVPVAGILQTVSLTQAEYDALSTKDNQTLYLIAE